ncbi:hypothetical protein CL634_01585 [bacterium]|nr:hypothetical protein [bacterium]
MDPKLTIGMATYEDFHGVYFSIQALRMYHPEIMDQVEFVVVDNKPDSSHGREVKKFMKHQVHGQYIPFSEWESTGVRDVVFREAKGEYVLCMDCHVLFSPGSLKRLLDHYDNDPDTKDIIQGPLMYDNFDNFSTHFNPEWRSQMFGTWATNEEALKKGDPFDIPMCGLGMFTCKKEHWPGFNKQFRGFGGEEWYIHEKFRQRGGRALCLPFLKWMHRFGRPDGVKFPLTLENKVRNYMIGWLELYKDPNNEKVQSIIDHFSEWKPREQLEKMLLEVLNGPRE